MRILEITDLKSKAIVAYIQELSEGIKSPNNTVKIVGWRDAFFSKRDISHFHYSNSTYKIIIPLLLSHSKRNIVTIHDVVPRNKNFRKFISPIIYRVISFKATFIIVHTNHAKEMLHSNYKFVNTRKVVVVPFGINPSTRDVNVNHLKKKYSIENHDVVFIYVGYLKRAKGIEKTINAIKQIKKNNLKFFIIGKITDNSLVKIFRDINDQRIKYVGFVSDDELYNYYSISDALVNFRQNSVGETSAAVMNMFKFGKPVLATDVGSNFEVIGNAGMLTEYSVESIKQSIEKFVSDKDFRGRLTDKAQKKRDLYSWHNLKNVYNKLFNGNYE